MSNFFGREELYEQIQKIADQSQNLKFAVAFWGEGSADFIENLKFKKLKIIVNLLTGVTNPYEIEKIDKFVGVEIRHNSRLHSKVYWAEAGTIVGSSNLSSNGMRFEGMELDGWIESNFLIKSKTENEKIEKWFDEVWSQSFPLTPEDIEKAKKLRIRTTPPPRESLLEAFKQNPAKFKNKNIHLGFYKEWIFPSHVEELYEQQASEEQEEEYDGYYWDWELPSNAYVINFMKMNDGSANFDGFCRILKNPMREKDGEFITLCKTIDNFSGLKLTEADEEILQGKAQGLCAKYHKGDGAKLISLYKAREILSS